MTKAKDIKISDEERVEMARPREYDRLAIGKDMIKFATDNPDCLTIPHYTSTIGLSSDVLCDWAEEDMAFRPLFKAAKEIIGLNRLNATRCDTLHNTIYHRGAGHYDSSLHRFERGEKVFESKLKQAEVQTISQDDRARFEALEDQLKEVRKETKLRRIMIPKDDNA